MLFTAVKENVCACMWCPGVSEVRAECGCCGRQVRKECVCVHVHMEGGSEVPGQILCISRKLVSEFSLFIIVLLAFAKTERMLHKYVLNE